MRISKRFAALLCVKLLLAGLVLAQTTTGAADASHAPAAADQQQSSTPPPSDSPHPVPVLWISSIEVMRSTHAPQLDVIRVRGLAATEGWQSAELVPLTRGLASDGILDLALVAQAPEENTTPAAYPEVEAVFTIEPGHPFKGVRVHGATNRVSLYTFPGYATSGPAPKTCADCQGKTFVPKGKPMLANANTAVVHEEELPRNLRVLRENDGLGNINVNPNRMTLLLDEKGKVIAVLWD